MPVALTQVVENRNRHPREHGRRNFSPHQRNRRVEDGLPGGEGAFLPCTFWLADNYELMGRHAEAEQLLEWLLKLRNDMGLLSEEYHLKRRCLVGNFPQAFSHVALVNTIINLYTERGPAFQRADSHTGRGGRLS